nr:ribonuclease J [Butyrivibrio sp.]
MSNKVKIIPLGGFDKIGMNMTIIEYQNTIVVIDCGTSFPPNNMPGIDTVIPDISYLLNNKEKVKGIVLTHGHEDHIGAIPFILRQLNVPVYGTPLTIALTEKKISDMAIKKAKTKVIKLGNTIVLGDFKIEFIRANHSIPDAAMLAIYTPKGIIFHTGDFKIDLSPITGDSIDLRRISSLGSKGILALLSDSTNALREGFSPSEADVNVQLDMLYNKYKDNRLIIATFASNMDRVQQIISLAYKYGRKVILQGETMLSIFSEAEKLGYLHIPQDILISTDEISKFKDNELVFVTTGNHGEPITCLMDIASGKHPLIKLCQNDVILFSSIAIHGSEKSFSKILNDLEEQGATIVFQDIHATGHACAEELRLIYTLLSPKYLIPSHGEFRYRKAAAKLAISIGIPEENIFLIKNGDVLE